LKLDSNINGMSPGLIQFKLHGTRRIVAKGIKFNIPLIREKCYKDEKLNQVDMF